MELITGTPEEIVKWLFTQERDKVFTISEFRRKRSLNANAYFHVLVDKLAEKMRLSHTEVHNMMIADYGRVDEELSNIIMDDEIPWEKVQAMHLRPTKHTQVLDNGKLYRVYLVMRGSHTYNSLEMAHLIDGTVQEAKQHGIETMTPAEIERMTSLWRAK
jgi:hypothetical protein